MECVLCCSKKIVLISVPTKKQVQNYFRCEMCYIIFLDPAVRLSANEEKNRYEKHENNVADLGYQAFVKPLQQAIVQTVSPNCVGLDYGSGKDSAISYLLDQQGFKINKYDPYFNFHAEVLKPHFYDYIIACEVVEHFYQPQEELKKIKSLLKPGGHLFIMTSLWTEKIKFQDWSYRRDSTHVCFFSAKTFSWISSYFNFPQLQIVNDQMIILS